MNWKSGLQRGVQGKVKVKEGRQRALFQRVEQRHNIRPVWVNLLLNCRLELFGGSHRRRQVWNGDGRTLPLLSPFNTQDVFRAVPIILPIETPSRWCSGITAHAYGHAADFPGLDNINEGS